MEKIATEVQRSGKTISDLLELARSRPPARRRVDARDFVAQAIPAAHLPVTTWSNDVPAGLPLDADPDQLARVAHEPAHQRQPGHAHGARAGVLDRRPTGRDRHGPPACATTARASRPRCASQVFEALFTTKAKGSGLGLALCRRIAEAHGGTVTLEPSERGAVFLVSIPDQSSG